MRCETTNEEWPKYCRSPGVVKMPDEKMTLSRFAFICINNDFDITFKRTTDIIYALARDGIQTICGAGCAWPWMRDVGYAKWECDTIFYMGEEGRRKSIRSGFHKNIIVSGHVVNTICRGGYEIIADSLAVNSEKGVVKLPQELIVSNDIWTEFECYEPDGFMYYPRVVDVGKAKAYWGMV